MAQEQELTLEQALAKIAEQKTEIEGLNTRVEDLEGESAESTQIISDLQEQLSNAQAGQALSETVVVTYTPEGGTKEQYQVVLPKFKYKGKSYVAADLKTNADLVKELVEGGKGVLVKLEKPAPATKAPAKAKAAKEEASK